MQLAGMVGSNREAVTRAFGRLKRAGVVELKARHIYVTDLNVLTCIARSGRLV
jgi:DNA-binding transcriptional regulator YhcF (GntR family)